MINLSLLEQRQTLILPDEYKDLAGKKLLVTGAAGFIGGALFKRLVEYDLDVVGTVLYQEEADTLREKGYKVEVLDLASDASWDDLLQGIDIVFNIAALFQEVENTEAMYHKVNVDGTLKLLKTAEKAGVERFVHCSTVGVHGHVKEIPCTEKTPFNPMDEYHRTKLEG
ncbi:MAG: NAD(P)-dependent oxidoreductase, partial [Arenicellales bacterium]